jgi:hypothetical protein
MIRRTRARNYQVPGGVRRSGPWRRLFMTVLAVGPLSVAGLVMSAPSAFANTPSFQVSCGQVIFSYVDFPNANNNTRPSLSTVPRCTASPLCSMVLPGDTRFR